MQARVTTFEGPADQLEEGARQARDQILPAVRQLAGFKGMYLLADRGSGKALAITLWESEEALRASEEAANRLRQDSARSMGEEIRAVDRYEVVIAELEG
jgi:heme-degrading monooxygenase HmoA